MKEEDLLTRRRSVATILAILFSFFTWLYTYDMDAWKFWLGVFLYVVGIATFLWILPLFVWMWAIIEALFRPAMFYDYYEAFALAKKTGKEVNVKVRK